MFAFSGRHNQLYSSDAWQMNRADDNRSDIRQLTWKAGERLWRC